MALGEQGLFTYHGNYYALGAMTALDLESSGGAVRAGYLHYTTEEEADRLRVEVDAGNHFPDVDRTNNVWTRS